MYEDQSDVASMCKESRQFGVGFPGGVDVLVHFRLVLEKIARARILDEVLAILDVDFKNMFPSLEWDSIRASIAEFLPKLFSWCNWCHKAPSLIRLPSGAVVFCDRGAEQRDPLEC